MLITLINPPILMKKGNSATIKPAPPLGLAYVVGSLEANFNVKVIDAIGEALNQATSIKGSHYYFWGQDPETIVSKIDPNSDIIGLSCMFTSNWPLHRDIIKKIQLKYPKSLVVLGGEHTTGSFKNILEEFPKNLVCVLGEGEEVFKNFCTTYSHNPDDAFKTEGIAYNKNGQVIHSRAKRMNKIDDIPYPSWKYFPIENYLADNSGVTVHNRRIMVMLASRGCPYKCSFCSAPVMWGSSVYYRSPECIIEEIKLYIHNYKVNHIEFMDLVGLVNKNWTLDFCEKIKKADLGISFTFSPGTRSEILTKEVLSALKSANLMRIQYAPDSGSTEEAKLLKKNANLEKMIQSMKYSVELELPICTNILIGYPGQKKKQLLDTGIFCLKLAWLGVNDVLIHNFVPYSGSEFFEDIKDELTENDLMLGVAPSLGYVKSYAKDIPSWLLSIFRLTFLALCLGLQYLRRPKRILKTIINIKNKTPVTYFENLIYLKVYKEKDDFKFNKEVVIRI